MRMATRYGDEIGIGQEIMIGAIVLVQFVGIPFAFLFGMLAGRIGAKRSIALGLLGYTAICIFGYFMSTGIHFLVLAVMVGVVQGGTQALSRSLFASLIPRDKSGEFFGFFGVAEKFAGIFGPAIFGLVNLVTDRAEIRFFDHRFLRRRAGSCWPKSTLPKVSAWRVPKRPRRYWKNCDLDFKGRGARVPCGASIASASESR